MSFPVQSHFTDQAGSSTTTSSTFASNQTLGNINVVAVGNYSGSITPSVVSVTDTLGNAYSLVVGPVTFGLQGPIAIYWCPSIKSGPNTVTVTWSVATTFTEIVTVEYPAITNPLIDSTTFNASTSATTSISLGPFNIFPADMVISYFRSSTSAGTPPAGFTIETASVYGTYADQQSATGGLTTLTWTGTSSTSIGALAFTIKSFTVPSGTSPAFYQSGLTYNPGASSAVITTPYLNPQQAGNTNLLLIAAVSGTNIISIADSAGNTYQFVGSALGTVAPSDWTYASWIYVATNIRGYPARNIVTVTFSSANAFNTLCAMEYTRANYVAPIDGYSSQVWSIASGSATPMSGSAISSQPNDLVVSMLMVSQAVTYTIPAGNTLRVDASAGFEVADTTVTAAGFNNPIWGVTGSTYPIAWMCHAVNLSSTPAVPVVPSAPVVPLLPPMGWDSWRYKGLNITQAQVLTQAAAVVSTGLSALGYQFVNASGQLFTGRSGGNLVPGAGFTNVATMSASIIALGLKYALYNCVGPEGSGCGTEASSGGYEQTDAALFASLNASYLMYDDCYDFQTSANAQAGYAAMGLALQQTGKNIIYLASCPVYADGTAFGSGVQTWCTQAGAGIAISAFDLGTPGPNGANLMTYATFLTQLTGVLTWAQPSSPRRINWLDYLGVANTVLTVAEGRSNFCLWAILACPLWVSTDLTTIGAPDLATLSNTEVIAVDQDPLCLMGTRYSHVVAGSAFADVWAKQLSGGGWAVVLMNQDTVSHTVTATWSMFGQGGQSFTVRDVINHVNLGVMSTGYSATVATHDVAMIVLTPTGTVSPPPPIGLPAPATWVPDQLQSSFANVAGLQPLPPATSTTSLGSAFKVPDVQLVVAGGFYVPAAGKGFVTCSGAGVVQYNINGTWTTVITNLPMYLMADGKNVRWQNPAFTAVIFTFYREIVGPSPFSFVP
jgi:alpha-galactosidase